MPNGRIEHPFFGDEPPQALKDLIEAHESAAAAKEAEYHERHNRLDWYRDICGTR